MQYVAFLRAINLGATRKLSMATVREALTSAGYTDVDTFRATGNVRVSSSRRSPERVRADLERVLAEAAGFDVPTVVVTPAELAATCAEAQALALTAQRRYVAWLPEPLSAAAVAELRAWDVPGEGVHVGTRHLHWWADVPTPDARIFARATLRRLGIADATSRDLAVVATLTERWTR